MVSGTAWKPGAGVVSPGAESPPTGTLGLQDARGGLSGEPCGWVWVVLGAGSVVPWSHRQTLAEKQHLSHFLEIPDVRSA